MKYIDHYFRTEIAVRHGVDLAIFVRDIYAWCAKNRDNEEAFHSGRYWTYNKMSAFCKRHPYWSKRQLERIIAASKEAGLVLIDRFNEDPMDRTNWYAITDYALSFYENDSIPGKCKPPNREMQTTEQCQTKHQTGKCIYKEDNTEEENTEYSPYSPPEGDSVSAGPASKDKPKSDRRRFVPPDIEQVAAYCRERGNDIDPETFVDYYASKGWTVGRAPMKDWKAAVRTWEQRRRAQQQDSSGGWMPDPEVMS